jgi:hypothetical protein
MRDCVVNFHLLSMEAFSTDGAEWERFENGIALVRMLSCYHTRVGAV